MISDNRSLMATQREVAEFVKKVKRDKAWMTDFNVERNYSSPFRVEELMEDWALTHSAVIQVCCPIHTLRSLRFTQPLLRTSIPSSGTTSGAEFAYHTFVE